MKISKAFVMALLIIQSTFILDTLSSVGATNSTDVETSFFEDNFDGTAISDSKWNNSFATSGLRWCSTTSELHVDNPGNWQNVATTPCNGLTQSSPYGTVSVSNGLASFQSPARRTFPYIWTGEPSKSSPFPSSGDFVLEVRMIYNALGGGGDGFFVHRWANTDPVGNNPPGGQARVFMIWADGSGLSVVLLGQQIPIPNPTGMHHYTLSYVDGSYTLLVDGFPILGPSSSDVRPSAIWVGHPAFTHWTLSDWSDFSLDLVRVKVPSIQLTPDNGSLGTKVVVQGTGFPSSTLGPFSPQVLVTFDDMLLGLARAKNGTFTFTFSVPHAEPGPHVIMAFDQISGAQATAEFQMIAVPDVLGGLTLFIEVGGTYAPGDTALVYVLIMRSGTLASPNTNLQLTLTKPDGSTVALNATTIEPGFFKVSYEISRTGSVGTYTLLARASIDGRDGLAVRTFQVRQSSPGTATGPLLFGMPFFPSIAAGLVAAIAAGVAVAWRRGYLKRNKAQENRHSSGM